MKGNIRPISVQLCFVFFGVFLSVTSASKTPTQTLCKHRLFVVLMTFTATGIPGLLF